MFEPLGAIDALNAHQVDYVVVGGWGALQHGATRLTQDIDIVPDLNSANLDRLGKALESLHAAIAVGDGQNVPVPRVDGRLLEQMQIGNWDTDAGGLDVLHEIPGATGGLSYTQLRANAVDITVDGRAFLVASLQDITASKRAAGRPKDLQALPELDQLLSTPPSRAQAARRLTDMANTQPCTPRAGEPPGQRQTPGTQPSKPPRARGRSY